MRWRALTLTISLGAAAIATGSGCSDAHGSGDAAIEKKRDAAGSELSRDLVAVAKSYDSCANQVAKTGRCASPSVTGSSAADIGIRDVPSPLAAVQQKIDQVNQIFSGIGSNICGVLGPLSSLDHPYFYYGGYAQEGIIGQIQGGEDVVFDLSNLQSAVFGYKGVGVAASVGAEAGAYVGYGFGNKSGVLDAWSGRFCTATGSIGLPAQLLSANASVFASPDMSVFGASLGISGGINLLDPGVSGGAFAADWGEWDAATTLLGSQGWFVNQTVKTDPATGRQYVQYASPTDMALALLWNAPMPFGATAAAQVIALDLQKKSGLTIAQMCPAQAAASHPTPDALKLVGQGCAIVPSLPSDSPSGANGGSSSSSSSSSPSNGGGASANPDGGGVDGGPDDSCVGREDGVYCSILASYSAIVCKSGVIAGGQQCPNEGKCVGPNGPGTMIACN